MDEKRWLKHLSDKLNDYEEPAPDGLWDDIAKTLASGTRAQQNKHRAVVVPLWLRRAGAVAAVALIAIAIWFATDTDTKEIVGQQPTEAYNDNTLNNIPTLTKTDNLREEQNPAKNTKTNVPVRSLVAATGAAVGHSVSTETEIHAADTAAVPAQKPTDDGNGNSDRRGMVAPNDAPASAQGRASRVLPIATKTNPSASSRIALNLYAANLSGASSRHSEIAPSLRSQYMSGTGLNQLSSVKDAIELSNSNKDVTSKMNHKFPVRVGFAVRYDFSHRFGLSTGVQYSYLASDFEWGGKDSYYSGSQKLHYIGIPVNVICNIWSNYRFSIYASAGMTMEKCVEGSIATDYYLNGRYETRETADVTENRLQWSANAAVGVQCRLFSHLSLFAEPGVSYYIDNGSSIENIYKEKPFNFNFNFGLRFTLH